METKIKKSRLRLPPPGGGLGSRSRLGVYLASLYSASFALKLCFPFFLLVSALVLALVLGLVPVSELVPVLLPVLVLVPVMVLVPGPGPSHAPGPSSGPSAGPGMWEEGVVSSGAACQLMK